MEDPLFGQVNLMIIISGEKRCPTGVELSE